MDDVLKNGRICPNPQYWNKLWGILKSKTNEKIPAPLILAAWWHTSDNEKTDRFKHHLMLAEKLDAVAEVKTLLESLNESDWHHKDE
jgi:hypothetical protein